MIISEAAIRNELATVENYLARIAEAQRIAQGERDRLLLALTDSEGTHDRRPTAIR